MTKNILYTLLGIVIGVLLCRMFHPEPKVIVHTIVETKTVEVEVEVEKIVYVEREKKPVKIPVVDGKKDLDNIIYTMSSNLQQVTATATADTTYITTEEHLIDFSYADTTITMEGTAAILADNLYSFKLRDLVFTYPEKTITHTVVQPPQNNLLVGGNLNFEGTTKVIQGFDVNVGWKTRQDYIFEIGYNVNLGGSDIYKVGFKIPVLKR